MDYSTDDISKGTPQTYLPVSLKEPTPKPENTVSIDLGDIELKSKVPLNPKKRSPKKQGGSQAQSAGSQKDEEEDLENLNDPLIPKIKVRVITKKTKIKKKQKDISIIL